MLLLSKIRDKHMQCILEINCKVHLFLVQF